MEHVPVQRFCEFMTPNTVELQFLDELKSDQREYRRKEVITREGEKVANVFLLRSGWVTSSFAVDSGKRNQLVKLHFPGDVLGLPSIALTKTAETLIAATPTKVDVIPIERLASMFERAPRLAFTLFLSTQQERLMLMDHLAAVSHTSAQQRVAALLMYVHRRLKLFGECSDVLDLPMSQQQIADAAGLTSVHVNRTLGELKRADLICTEGKVIRLLDIDRLEELAAFPDRASVRDPWWLTSIGQQPFMGD